MNSCPKELSAKLFFNTNSHELKAEYTRIINASNSCEFVKNSCPFVPKEIFQRSLKKSLTLIELLIAIGLLSVIILAISNMDLFTRFHTISADRRVKLQNEVSYVLEHMTKEIGKAIGDIGNIPVNTAAIAGNLAVRFYVDLAIDGLSPGDGQKQTGGDRWRAYRYRDSSAPPAERYQIWYCPECTNSPCTNCNPNWGSQSNLILSKNILSFNVNYDGTEVDGDPIDNYVNVSIAACWDSDGTPNACGTPDNPNVAMSNHIKMPSVSTH